MADDIRLSDTTLRALKLLLAAPLEGRSGAEISKGALIGSGTMYPMLARLETAGWLKGDWEDVNPKEAGRPRRRLYSLTTAGRARARAAFAEFQDVSTGVLAWNS